jgi:hypothetical protein
MTTAAEVIQQHADLTKRWCEPNPRLSEYIGAFAEDVAQRRGIGGAVSMFYPMRSSRDPEPWVRLIGKGLFTARTYQVTAEMCRVTTQAYRKTERTSTVISLDELPTESGFIWLDEAVMLHDRQGKRIGIRAVTWEVTSAEYRGKGVLSMVRLVTWADTRVKDDYSPNWEPGVLKSSEKYIGRLQLQHVCVFPLDYAVDVSSSDNESPLTDDHVAWFHAMLMLMATDISSTHNAGLPRSVLGDVKKLVKHPRVSVVDIHRTSQPHGNRNTSRVIEWTHRWLVQGHHRHLESYEVTPHRAIPERLDRGHCAICESRITWVRPFVKGPDGAPVKSADVVYRLSR